MVFGDAIQQYYVVVPVSKGVASDQQYYVVVFQYPNAFTSGKEDALSLKFSCTMSRSLRSYVDM